MERGDLGCRAQLGNADSPRDLPFLRPEPARGSSWSKNPSPANSGNISGAEWWLWQTPSLRSTARSRLCPLHTTLCRPLVPTWGPHQGVPHSPFPPLCPTNGMFVAFGINWSHPWHWGGSGSGPSAPGTFQLKPKYPLITHRGVFISFPSLIFIIFFFFK